MSIENQEKTPEQLEEERILGLIEFNLKKSPVESGSLSPEEISDKIKKIEKAFDEGEAIFASEGREKTKPFMNNIDNDLLVLNKSVMKEPYLKNWNPGSYLTKEQFDELNLRRNKLSNAMGMEVTATGEIRHNLNDIKE